MRRAVQVVGGVVAVIGLIDLPEQLRKWADLVSRLDQDAVRWGLFGLGMATVLAAQFWPRSKQSTHAKSLTDDLPETYLASHDDLGPFDQEMMSGWEISGMFPAGTTLLTRSDQILRRFRRVILCHPDGISPLYAQSLMVDPESLANDIRRVTRKLQRCGVAVRWYPHPTGSMLIDDNWARAQMLVPFTPSSSRPVVRAKTYSPLFMRLEQAYEKTWERAEDAPPPE